MRRNFMLSALFAVLMSVTALPQSTTEIRVRILHSKSHRAMKGRKIEIQFSGMDSAWYQKAGHLIEPTHADGVVVFRIKQPVPPRIDIVDLKGYPCSFPEEFSTEEIVQKGIIARWSSTGVQKADEWCTPDSNATQPQATPGEVVFFVHPLTFRQRLERAREE
jgi:hypothetical protein